MASMNKQPQIGSSASAAASEENPPSNNLWIGNVSAEVSDNELKALLENFGKVESISSYPARNYAFVYFKDMEAAIAAKQNLQGHLLHGNPLKIEFARRAKPCKILWVSGIGQSVSREELEKEFLKFGKIQEFRFLRDRSTAFVDYVRLEDATQALKNMSGKRIRGDQLRVDFLRSQHSRREQGPDSKESQFVSRNMGPSDMRWTGHDSFTHYPEPSGVGSKRQHQFILPQPSRVLLISHPPDAIIEENRLHNAMILFGEIEGIKTFPDRNYAFVEFRSVEEARYAKEGLQGKLFNDPRITIEFASSEITGARGHGGEFPIQRVQMDVHGVNRPVLPGNNPLTSPAPGIRGPDLYNRPPLGPHSAFEPATQGTEYNDLAPGLKLQNSSPRTLMGGPTWRRTSPTPGLSSSPAGLNVTNRSAVGWDAYDSSQLQRESKRSRFEAALPLERTENYGGSDEQYGLRLPSTGRAPGSLTRVTTESDCIWRGLITKGGTPVCRARCVPIGEGIDADIPDVVNCSARTGLDMLSKHYEDAIGFSSVFFLPDSEEDFASYTEFLRFLGSRNRAGVAKFGDGTTLFLVPPSEFLTNVLKVSGPERLYGVVLKFPAAPSTISVNPPPVYPRYEYREEKVPPLGNFSVLLEEPSLPPKAPGHGTSSLPANSVSQTPAASLAGVTLTPELIATLTSLIPPSTGSSGSQAASSFAAGRESTAAHWRPEHQALDHQSQLVPQLGNSINSQGQHVAQDRVQAPPPVPHSAGHFYQPINSYSHMHETTINLPHPGTVSSKQMAPVMHLPTGPGPVTSAPDNRQYQPVNPEDAFRPQGADALTLYNPSLVQQPAYPAPSSNLQNDGVSHPQQYTPLPSELQFMHQSGQLQTTTQENAESEEEKNERYKTTLLFAANLLSRIHQPPSNQSGQGRQ